MRILITGSNGFIGHHVCDWLRRQGCYVVGVGRKERSLVECDEYICCDLHSEEINHLFEQIKCDNIDAVVHLASDMRREPHTVSVVDNNLVGTQRLLELCELKKVSVFVQLSSLPVIGSPLYHPITEEHPLKPPTVYHITKHTQELLANYAHYTFGLRTVSFRISAPVGEGVNPSTIFPVFVKNAVNGEDITIFGKGSRKQTYVHVNDIAQAIYKAILAPNAQGVYNLASHNLISNIELAKKCIALTGSTSKIVFTEKSDPYDGMVWDVSLDRIKKDIAYEPIVSIEDAILEYAELIKCNK